MGNVTVSTPFLSAADQYNAGRSEEVVGRLIANDRSDWILATKAAAERCFQIAYRSKSKFWELRAATSLAPLWRSFEHVVRKVCLLDRSERLEPVEQLFLRKGLAALANHHGPC